MDRHYLTSLLAPSSVAVFAGSPTARANDPAYADAALLHEAISSAHYSGRITFMDIDTTEGRLADLVHTGADLAVVALPHDKIATALELAGRINCKAALVIANGIDAEQARHLHHVARQHGMWMIGPNGRGFQRPRQGLNASTLGPLVKPGALALVSQSGALTASIIDWAQQNRVGFSSVITLGQHSAVGLAHALDFLANDPHTQSIVVYLEGIPDARHFMSALRVAANSKPVVVLKAGRSEDGQSAALTHSAAIVGSDEVFDAALRRGGAVRIHSFSDLFSAVQCLAARYQPVGNRLGIITNGGGPGVLAADRAANLGLQLGRLGAERAQELQAQVLPKATLCDLIDLTEDATPEHFAAALAAAARDPGLDGILVIQSPKPGVDMSALAQALIQARTSGRKPLLACVMGGVSVEAARALLVDANIPTFRTPDAAVNAFGNISAYYRNQQSLQQTPPPLTHLAAPDVEGARMLIEGVLAQRRYVLTEMESKALLSAFHIPVTQTILARTPSEAVMLASQLGYPVALKIDSPDIAHKSDVDGVVLNVSNGVAVRDVFERMMKSVARQMPNARINGVSVQRMARQTRGRELYIGMSTEAPFGPVIAFGAGGHAVELYGQRSMELPPLNQFLARQMIEHSNVAQIMGAWRGANPVNQEALEQVLLRVSEMVCELPQLREMDINPIIVDENGAVAVDARIIVDNVSTPRPYQHLSILPYPARFHQSWPLPGDSTYTVRPIHPDDAQMLQELVRGLSPESRYNRFASSITEMPPSMLSRLTLIDYDREMALVAVLQNTRLGDEADEADRQPDRIIAVSRYITNPDSSSCEFSLLVADDFAGKGIGSRMMRSIMDVAREKGLSEIIGLVLAKNTGMLRLMTSLGFSINTYEEDPDFKIVTHQL
ncbi:MAG: bifunctional acetate--CoA ligase family protein/GNAT family N-acetyltransferase [Brachymonas sp.]|nr:bifunctional acetate--CoA ligase family protein/GNAT family N-acetyltransferase [Brachymonas sp.]